MPLGEIAGEALGGIVRVVGRILFEVFFELTIQGTGYILVRTVRPEAEPDDTICTVVGLLFWVVVGVGGYFVYRATAA
ncbi:MULTISPECIES: hypothetical protein [Xanthomonas]|uniref:ABC transporter permease n=1 Tax=Xanthomonas arboricola TaxID=56448 RepID=A0AB73GZT7_9XANT|nr:MULTISPECIES: hypothetical protein [Xanthomonas]MBB5671468.1 hypothetical protein [Xanthomonas arboricola]UYB52748.1 hypothetical protein OCJ37_01915 [Xanthomonas sp. AM6]